MTEEVRIMRDALVDSYVGPSLGEWLIIIAVSVFGAWLISEWLWWMGTKK